QQLLRITANQPMPLFRNSNRYGFIFVRIEPANHRSRRSQQHFMLAAPPAKQNPHTQSLLVVCHEISRLVIDAEPPSETSGVVGHPFSVISQKLRSLKSV